MGHVDVRASVNERRLRLATAVVRAARAPGGEGSGWGGTVVLLTSLSIMVVTAVSSPYWVGIVPCQGGVG